MAVVGQRGHPNDKTASRPVGAPDVVVVDHGERDTVERLTALAKSADGGAPFIVLTSSTETTLLANVFRQGGRGLVSKHQAPKTLIHAIQKVHAGEIWLERGSTAQLITDLLAAPGLEGTPRKRKPLLSHRDLQIVTLVSQGLKNGQIAKEIRVSEATVRNRLTSVFKTLGVTGRLQLVVYACQKGLVKLPLESTQRRAKRDLRLV